MDKVSFLAYSPIGGVSLLCFGALLWAYRSGQKSWYLFALGFALQLIGQVITILVPAQTPASEVLGSSMMLSMASVIFIVIGIWISAITLLILAITAAARPNCEPS